MVQSMHYIFYLYSFEVYYQASILHIDTFYPKLFSNKKELLENTNTFLQK